MVARTHKPKTFRRLKRHARLKPANGFMAGYGLGLSPRSWASISLWALSAPSSTTFCTSRARSTGRVKSSKAFVSAGGGSWEEQLAVNKTASAMVEYFT
jgi:hypothetical protein